MHKKVAMILIFLSLERVYSYTGTVGTIQVDGLWRTKEYVVLRELTFSEGDDLTKEREEESIIRLRNLRLFSEVQIEVQEGSDGLLQVRIKVTEKWTIIPIFKTGGGGGINYLTIGIYDINVLGHYIEFGGQYERLGSTNSGVLWFRNPRFLGERFKLSGDFWMLSRNQMLYNENAELTGGYTNHTNRISFICR